MKLTMLIPTLLLLCGCTASLNVPGMSGNATTATTGNAATPSANSNPTAGKIVTSVSVTPNNFVLTIGDAKNMIAVVNYSDGSHDGNVSWSSSDSRIVDVNPTTGQLTAKAEGVATVQVTSLLDTSKTANVTVTVRQGTVQAAFGTVTPSAATLKLHDTVQLQAKIQMSDGSTSPNVTWSSSNQSIAIVSGAGLVTAVGSGTATITAAASTDSTKTASCTVTVQ